MKVVVARPSGYHIKQSDDPRPTLRLRAHHGYSYYGCAKTRTYSPARSPYKTHCNRTESAIRVLHAVGELADEPRQQDDRLIRHQYAPMLIRTFRKQDMQHPKQAYRTVTLS
jgi:hypothetical protein